MTIKRRPIYVLRERRIFLETFVFVSDSVKKSFDNFYAGGQCVYMYILLPACTKARVPRAESRACFV